VTVLISISISSEPAAGVPEGVVRFLTCVGTRKLVKREIRGERWDLKMKMSRR
jgi:hypothetical protein